MKNIFKKHNKKKLSAIALISIICLHLIYQSIMAYKVSLNTLGDDIIIVNVYRASPFDKFFDPSTFKSKRYLQDKEAFQIANNYCNFKEDNDVYLFLGKDDQNKPSFVDGAEFKGIGNHIYDQVASMYKWKFRFICSPDLNTALTKFSDNLENFKTSIDGTPVSFHIKSRDQQTLITPELLQQNKKSTEKKETIEQKETRTVEKSNIDEAWKVDGKFIIPECFDYIMVSGDRYEAFYDEYFKEPQGSHWDDPKFVKFTENVGMYLNKEVPLNHSIDRGWDRNPKISLTKQLEGCLSEKPETFVRFKNEFNSPSTAGYKVVHNFDRYIAKELAPYIDQIFESVKQVEIESWGGGSMPSKTHMVVFGVLELEGKKVLLPLRNKSILTEIAKRDTFFRGNGRFSYEAEFDLNDDITKIININDFKQMVSSDGCFKINDFATDGKIYNFLNKNKLKTYCNEVRPFDDINWLLKQREFEDSQDLIFDDKEYRFSNLIRSQVPDIQVPWADDPYRLPEELIESIWFNGDIQYLKNRQQVVITGCVYKFCTQKGLIFAYKDNFIGLIRHGTEEWDVDDFFIFSKKHKNFIDLPDSFFVAVKAWIAEKEIKITETKEKKLLGVRIEEVTKEIAEVKELKNTNGTSIVSVDKTSPAGKAGLKAGDIILKFDGKKIEDYQSIGKVISETKIDKTVKLEIWRNKKLVTKNLTLVSTKIPGSRVRFIGSDNKINEVENLFVKKKIKKTKKKIKKIRKKANEVEIVQGYEGILQKQLKDTTNALMKNYNAELFDLINKEDTARTILKDKEFEYALSKEINEKWIDFSRKGNDQWSFLNEKFYYHLFNSSLKAVDININNNKYFIVSGCADISCDEGALLYIDKEDKIVIGTLIHKYLGKDNLTEINSVVIFSKKIDVFTDLPVYFYAKHAQFMTSIYYLTKRKGDMMFIGSDNKDTPLTFDDIIDFNGK